MKIRNRSILLYSGLLSLALLSSASQASTDRRVSVTGTCVRQVTPDRGAIVLTAEFRDDDLKAAARKATEAYERTRDAVKRLNLEALELRTVEYNVGRVVEWEKNRQVAKGFRARMGLRVATADTQRLGDVIALAAREGLQDVGQLTTFLSDEKLQKEHFACLQQAAEDAKARAEKLAGSLGARVGKPVELSEAAQEPGPVQPMMEMDAMRAGAKSFAIEAPSVEAGRQSLSVKVSATFALE